MTDEPTNVSYRSESEAALPLVAVKKEKKLMTTLSKTQLIGGNGSLTSSMDLEVTADKDSVRSIFRN